MEETNPAERYLFSLSSEQSQRAMRSLLNNAVRYIDKCYCIETFDWSTLSYYLVMKIRKKLKRVMNGQQVKAPATVNLYLAALKGTAKHAWKLGLIEKDEYDQIHDEIPRDKGTREPTGKALTPKVLNAIIEYCMAHDGPIGMRDAALIAIMYGAGLRRTEATTLFVKDYKRKKGQILIHGKGNKERTNGLNPRLIDILEQWLDERGSKSGAIFVRVYKGGRITNEPISGQTVYDIIKRRCIQAGVKTFMPHDLRRSFATNLLGMGKDVFTVQDLMGHSDPGTTKKYDKRKKEKITDESKDLPF